MYGMSACDVVHRPPGCGIAQTGGVVAACGLGRIEATSNAGAESDTGICALRLVSGLTEATSNVGPPDCCRTGAGVDTAASRTTARSCACNIPPATGAPTAATTAH